MKKIFIIVCLSVFAFSNEYFNVISQLPKYDRDTWFSKDRCYDFNSFKKYNITNNPQKKDDRLYLNSIEKALYLTTLKNIDEQIRGHYYIQESIKQDFIIFINSYKKKKGYKKIALKNIHSLKVSFKNYDDKYEYLNMIDFYNSILSDKPIQMKKYLLEQSYTYLVSKKDLYEYLEELRVEEEEYKKYIRSNKFK